MKRVFLFAFFTFFLSGFLFADNATQTAQSLSQNLELTSFTVNPSQAYAGDTVVLLLGVKSTGNIVSTYSSAVRVYDSLGKQQAEIGFLDSTISGGETQSLSKGYDTTGFHEGNYSAIASISSSDGSSSRLIATFEILPSALAGAPEVPIQPAPLPKENPACSSPASCGAPGNCIDNYTTSQCTVALCPEKNYFLVQDCAIVAPQFQFEKQLCESAPALCSANGASPQNDWGVYFCSPILIALLIFAAFMLRKWEQGG